MQPILIFDGECGFCSASARFAERWVRPRSRIEPWQNLDLVSLGLTEQECTEAAQWVDDSGRVSSGARAIAAALRAGRSPWPVVGRVLDAPAVRPFAARVYRWVALNRDRFPGATPACSMN